jgi:putative ABC transport system ATP-binding protein
MEELIRTNNLSKKYLLGKTVVNALKGVSLEVKEGEILFIMGPSGSGKTTLLNLIGGIDTPSEGELFFKDLLVSNLNDTELTKYRKNHLSFVFQFYSLIPTLTAIENVELTMELVGIRGKELRKKAINYLSQVDLSERLNSYPSQLSGGERQRVAIARALAKNPDLLLIDEPTGQLDSEIGNSITSLIRTIAKEQRKTVILVTHDPSLIKYADRVIHLRSGQIESIEQIST